jgi:polyisoprenoid-binding protein YceI
MADAVALRSFQDVVVPEAGTYQLDPAHSVVEFVVRHLGLAKVRGRFNEFRGTFRIAEDPTDSEIEATIDAASIDTRDANRDEHLRTADFLDAENHRWVVDGDLTVRGVTRPVRLDLEFEGSVLDPWGNVRIGGSATGEINREDFGLTWNQALETGGWLVGKQVRLELSAEAIRTGD